MQSNMEDLSEQWKTSKCGIHKVEGHQHMHGWLQGILDMQCRHGKRHLQPYLTCELFLGIIVD